MRVQGRYAFAHSPGLTRGPAADVPHHRPARPVAGRGRSEGTDPALRGELDALAAANVLRQNTVIVHGTALAPEDGARLAAARASVVWCPESDRRLYGTDGAGRRAAGGRGERRPRERRPFGGGARRAVEPGRRAARGRARRRRPPAARHGRLRGRRPASRRAASRTERPRTCSRWTRPSACSRATGPPWRSCSCAGRPSFGEASPSPQAGTGGGGRSPVDGGRRALAEPLARRLATILRRHPPRAGRPGSRESRYNPSLRSSRGTNDAGAARDPVRDGGAEGQGARPARAPARHGGPHRQRR